MMSGFFPSAEIRKTGLDAASVGLQISSSDVAAREILLCIRLVQITQE